MQVLDSLHKIPRVGIVETLFFILKESLRKTRFHGYVWVAGMTKLKRNGKERKACQPVWG